MGALWHRPVYFVARAVDAMRRGRRVAGVATATIFVAVFVTGLFGGTLRGVERLLARWAGEVPVSVYLDPAADVAAARAAVAAAAPGLAIQVVTPEEALHRFRESLGPQGSLLDGLPSGVLPPAIEVRAGGLSLAAVRQLARRLEAVPGASDVDYGNAWLEPLERFVERARWVGIALFSALAAGAAVLVANTLRLGVFARRDEIEIMKLVGATDTFVELPFLVEGLLQGCAGGALAAGALLAGATVALPRVGHLLGLASPMARREVFPPGLLVALIGGGAALGLFASAIAVARELKRSA